MNKLLLNIKGKLMAFGNIFKDNNDIHSEPQDESEKDEQERDTHSVHSDISEEDN